ncbi:hypothetical protein AJ80_00372 [Polytolypa hystricis UAMH7299]|uniref:Uncharacterized protein n=1 Tax=Polytolypa hystricis (strain UAMH7299) TaxID=1447883 RepID=A0A2B7Z433_POLH7|nr:hypothetical protein AJ80_00372 [Polytolypa hystricis UAMH7299]
MEGVDRLAFLIRSGLGDGAVVLARHGQKYIHIHQRFVRSHSQSILHQLSDSTTMFAAARSSRLEHTLKQHISGMDLPSKTNSLAGVEIADTSSVARAIDIASWSAFLQVPFAEWVLKATGRDADLVDMFLWYHEMLSIRLYYRLQKYSKAEAEKIRDDLLEIASKVNPFAHTVILSSIESPNRPPVTCDLCIGFIINPLYELFVSPAYDLNLDVLDLLDTCFQHTYHQQLHNGKMAEFQTDISLFHSISHTLPELLAGSITENDMRSFCDNYALMFMKCKDLNEWLGSLGCSWNC